MLKRFFNENPKIALAFSGSVNSSYLLYEAVKYGADIRPYYVKTEFQPAFEYKDAKKMADYLGLSIKIIETDLLAKPDVATNGVDRCYHCTKEMHGKIIEAALLDGYPIWMDGRNASKDEEDRYGLRALAEMGVRSPLRECGVTEEEVRRLSREAGLFTWDKPSYSCLAMRIPAGRPITMDCLKKVEKAENVMFDLGFTGFHVRLLDDYARIQVQEEQMELFVSKRKEILSNMKGFSRVFLDLGQR